MRQVTILSPHRDDAVFSLAITLRNWCASGMHVRVVNFFTRSAYAPRAVTNERSPAILSALRKREDRLALRSLRPAIEVHDWSLLDAPLRLGRATADVMAPNSVPVRTDVDYIRGLLSDGYTVAPLGLGDHIDHRTVRDAAIEQIPPHRLAFYEDLPYAASTAEPEIHQRIKLLESKQRRALRLVTTAVPIMVKRRIASLYATQITPEDASAIASRRERIWTPEHSGRWL